jgi:hypothetical protein
MTLSATDIAGRVQRWLPSRWFPEGPGTRIWATISGSAASLLVLLQQTTYLKLQTRLSTATDGFLDLAASDFLTNFPRRLNEPDPAYAARIQREIIRPRNTRAAIVQVLQDLTGNTPTVFRPSYALDTGGLGTGSFALGAAGALGSYQLPFQAFVTIERGTAPGAGTQVTYPGPVSGLGAPLGGLGIGALFLGDGSPAQGGVTDDDIYAAVASVTPAGHINWVAITGGTPLPQAYVGDGSVVGLDYIST